MIQRKWIRDLHVVSIGMLFLSLCQVTFAINEFESELFRGSVEGLAVSANGEIVSVASDCTIVLQRVSECLKAKHIKSLL